MLLTKYLKVEVVIQKSCNAKYANVGGSIVQKGVDPVFSVICADVWIVKVLELSGFQR